MDILTHFLAYAGDFEKSYKDDEWTRLNQYFTDDAVYEVKGLGTNCRLQGPTAIFKGIKKSLDGFDRRFDSRKIDITSAPVVEGDTMRVGWVVTYEKKGLAPFPLRGRSEARYRDGKIAYLGDSYDAAMAADAVEWMKTNSFEFDPSYV
jgi:hypothetical protein